MSAAANHVTPYPSAPAARDRWIRSLRGVRHAHDVQRAHGFFVEPERTAAGVVVPTLTVLLASRECPWRCLMCDLWKFTVEGVIPPGAITGQMAQVLAEMQARPGPAPVQLKLYNGGSFFDSRAVPPQDQDAIAGLVGGFERVIVECHPALVGERCWRFRDRLAARGTSLEVAMGLETAHPEVLDRLNKRMTLDQFREAAGRLTSEGVAVRAFVLVKPPFLDPAEALEWAARSVDFAFEAAVSAVVLIPTRDGNGAMEALATTGQFAPPTLALFEDACDRAVGSGRGRVFADLWDLERFATCPACREGRKARLHQMNLTQTVLPRLACAACGS